MRRILKWGVRALLAVASVLTLLLGTGLLYRSWVQARAEAELVLRDPRAIDEELFVPLSDGEHWISIRGRDRRNPVVLMLHGGPGMGNGPLVSQFSPYEAHYTIVQWDQPGSGRTFRRNGNTLPANTSLNDVVDDGIAVAQFVRGRLGVERLILVGWSWGSVVGVGMAQKRPDLFAAYVGTGQVASVASSEAALYAQTLERARRLGDTHVVNELTTVGAPPYQSFEEFTTVRSRAAQFASEPSLIRSLSRQLLAPRYSLLDQLSYFRGVIASGEHFMGAAMDGPVFTVDLPATVPSLDLPVVFVQGAEDIITPAALARRYLDALAAPRKVYVALEGAGHSAVIESAPAFLEALDRHVRPLAPAAAGAPP